MLHGHVFVKMIYFRLLTGGYLLLHESSAESSCSMKVVQKAHVAISNHLPIAMSISSE